ncbi:putative protein pal1 [Phaeomoniella chlamydospora]|uniref:Uncharacterized protein n=1 Tax=Phaeomoniella chlamydospora TaxID=158046 RepID=A0A0G2FYE9_PHACM|nr:putative protein pal1 [Phaeomoniella chlamydospora]
MLSTAQPPAYGDGNYEWTHFSSQAATLWKHCRAFRKPYIERKEGLATFERFYRTSKSLETEEERRRRKHKEREARRRQGSKHKTPSHRLDVIDKLDVTSIFGTGGKLDIGFDMFPLTSEVFHHDGPFDACNPNRNKKGLRTAPMAAFPKDSSNMAIGGSGPVNKDIDHAQFHGYGVEGYNDYSTSKQESNFEPPGRSRGDERAAAFIPTMKVEPVHGDESVGLGTSTFLEGAPASRAAIQRRESENDTVTPMGGVGGGGGLGRKKSLAQRIRGISNSRPAGARITSPEPGNPLPRSSTPTSPPLHTSASIGTGNAKVTESNPFFQDYDKEYEKKGAKIAMAESNGGPARGMTSPRRDVPTLERTTTNDSMGGGEAAKTGGGFLSRVKSLKGGRRTRPERRDAS